MTLLEVRSVSKSYGVETTAVADASLSVTEGEIVCLLGPSGCGKTTLLRLIAGLEAVDAGEIWFDGRSFKNVPPHKRDFGMMFQDFALFPHKNVRENVAYGLQMRGDSREEIEARVAEMLSLVQLEPFRERDVNQLSGGEQQRVALARSLAPGPRLLMLDEPLGALDRALRERLMLEVRRILKEVGVTAVYVTHDQAEAFAVADRVVVMNAGRIEQVGPPRQVYAQPATPFVARFLGFHNLLTGRMGEDGVVETAVGSFRLPDAQLPQGEPVQLLIRPEAARLGGDREGGIEMRVTAVSFRGRFDQIWLEANGERLMFEVSDADCEAGDTVIVAVDPAGLRLFLTPDHTDKTDEHG